jgi:hypothetical protein
VNVATSLEQRSNAGPALIATHAGYRRPLGVLLAVIAIAVAAMAAAVGAADDRPAELIRAAVLMLWSLAGVSLAVRRPHEPGGLIILTGAVIGAIGSLGAARAPLTDGMARDLALLARWTSLPLMSAVAMHLVLGLPDGHLAKRKTRARLIAWYVVSGAAARRYGWPRPRRARVRGGRLLCWCPSASCRSSWPGAVRPRGTRARAVSSVSGCNGSAGR